VYHGGLSRRAKDQAVHDFSSDAEVLVTTEAAGEGRNLQFCHVMVNYDLPWNPMQIEQRLGRLHRIGQDHDVELTNLVTAGTIDDHLLRVLETKINLFELVVGELDMILGRISDELDLESAVFTNYVHAADDAEFTARLETLGDELAGARRDYLAGREATDLLVAEPA
jgi:SNF2 family DNA or RNA helicase